MNFRAVSLIVFLTIPVAAEAARPQSSALQTLIDEEWKWELQDEPERATQLGERGYDDRLRDLSASAFEKRREHHADLLRKVKAIDRSKVPADEQLNYELFQYDAQTSVDRDRFPEELMQINQMEGVHSTLSDLAQAIPRFTVEDHENFLRRLHRYPQYLAEATELLRRGAAQGVTPPRIILRDVAELIGNQIVDDPTKSPIYTIAFTNFPSTIPAAEQTRLQTEAAKAIGNEVVPALRRFRDFFVNEYLPKTRDAIGWSSMPQGRDWYAVNVRRLTTTNRTVNEIHELGLSEVKRIRAEMEQIKTSTGFNGTLAEFFQFLRTDPRFYYNDRESLLLGYRDIAKRIDPELIKIFGTLPRLPYGVIPVPAYVEKTTTTAYYNGGSPEAHRPGYFYANLYDLKSRPKWEMEALTLHEAVPGHHLQVALAQELTNVPKFRRTSGYTAFAEGWGLYAESLGADLGMYKDPYSRFGQLTYQMWRAVRLVVDTGMHAKGWTRDQAIKYFSENSSKPLHDIEVEIDRYLAWPAQSLAYKSGELKFKELRAMAERELGPKFDLRKFHDTLLLAGALPLSIVEERVKTWVANEKGSGAKATITIVK